MPQISAELKAALKKDMLPTSWLSKFQRVSYPYLLIMFFFYQGLAYLSGFAFDSLTTIAYPDYSPPNFQASLTELMDAGPFEDSLFFGMPFYAFGNTLVMVATGVLWASSHMFNTTHFDASQLNYANFLFALPYMFFVLRMWASGMGWLSIIMHSSYDTYAFTNICIFENSCNPGTAQDLRLVSLSVITVFATYYLYRRRRLLKLRHEVKSSPGNELRLFQLFPSMRLQCPGCGAPNISSANYCVRCGISINGSAEGIYAKWVRFLGRYEKPSKQLAIGVIIACFVLLVAAPGYVSLPASVLLVMLAVTRKAKLAPVIEEQGAMKG